MEIRTMLFSSWLRNWKTSLQCRSALNQIRRPRPATGKFAPRLRLEALEDRTLLSLTLNVNNLAESGFNGAVVSNSGTFTDTTVGATVTLTASAGTVAQPSNGTWSWSETTPSGAAQIAPVTIYATDNNGQTAAAEFWLNVGQVFIVNTTADSAAANLTTGQDSSGNISLRSAIQAVNAAKASTPALIAFQIAGTGPLTIQPQSALDPIIAPVVIDGYTQPGASPNTLTVGDNAVLKIVLDGSKAGVVDGLDIGGGNSTVRGLVIDNFPASGIELNGGGNDCVAGNFIGTDVTGLAGAENGEGIFVDSSTGGNTIGGTSLADRNIIDGHDGVYFFNISSASASGNLVQGNYIGTNAAGTAAPSGPGRWGVVLLGPA
jgi:hypothetical protein